MQTPSEPFIASQTHVSRSTSLLDSLCEHCLLGCPCLLLETLAHITVQLPQHPPSVSCGGGLRGRRDRLHCCVDRLRGADRLRCCVGWLRCCVDRLCGGDWLRDPVLLVPISTPSLVTRDVVK